MTNTPVTDRIQYPEVKLDGSALTTQANDSFDSLRVERSLWMPSRAVVRFDDPDFELTDAGTFAVGKALTISLPGIDGTLGAVFDGEITDLALEPGLGGRHQLVVGAMDKGHR